MPNARFTDAASLVAVRDGEPSDIAIMVTKRARLIANMTLNILR